MAKILWTKSRYHGQPKEGPLQVFFSWFNALDKYIKYSVITMLIIGIVTPGLIIGHFNPFQYAATNKSAIISVIPSTGSYAIGQQFVVNIGIDGGGQAFNAAQAKISVSSNITVQSLTVTDPASGGCNFTFINNQQTPTAASPTFAGAILNGSSTACVVFSMVVTANAPGTGTISINNGSVKSYANSSEILLSTQSGTYTLGSGPTPTVSPTPTNAPTATPIPTAIPTASPTPVPPTATPTPTIQVIAPTFDTEPTDTYNNVVTLTGTNALGTTVNINNSSTGITYPTTTTWQYSTNLSLGANSFTAYAQDNLGHVSSSISLNINLHKLGDISGDGIVDLTDLSMFATDWGNSGTLNYALSDMNGDGVVDLTDFSILAKAYGN